MRGYRGFLREFTRTGSLRALRLQVWTGVVHAARQLVGTRRGDPVKQFFGYYGPDGVTQPDAAASALALQATRCLACGLCDAECARVGGLPLLAPRDAVVAAARLELDWRRLGVTPGASTCSGCEACHRVCPAGIPIARVQHRLALLPASSEPAAATPVTPDATGAGIG